MLLQYFLFDNLGFGVYIHPLVYIAFIIMLPMEMAPVVVLILGLLLGVTVDWFSGASGLHTIATVAAAFLRLTTLRLFVGREQIQLGGVPTPKRIGRGNFIKYSAIVVGIHGLIYFTVEAFSFHQFHLTLLRVVASGILTTFLVYFARMLLISRERDSRKKGGKSI